MQEIKTTCSVCRGTGKSPFNSMAVCTHCGGTRYVYTPYQQDPWEAAITEWAKGLVPIWLRIVFALIGAGGSHQLVIASGLELPVWGLVCLVAIGANLAYDLPRIIANCFILAGRMLLAALACAAGVVALYGLLWVLDAPIVR
jgi:hypothetical protein